MDGSSPMEMQPPLYEVIDPEALETFFGDGRSQHDTGRDVGFTYGEYEVLVSDRSAGERTVTVTHPGEDQGQIGTSQAVEGSAESTN